MSYTSVYYYDVAQVSYELLYQSSFSIAGSIVFEQSSYTVSESAGNVIVCIVANGLTQNTTAIVFTQNTQPASATGKYFSQEVIILLEYVYITLFTIQLHFSSR